MLFYCKYISQGEAGEQIFDVLDESDLFTHCLMFHLDVVEYRQISFTEDNSDLYKHENGGVYSLIGKAVPAGDEARVFGLILVYQDIISKRLYYRHWRDFVNKLSVYKEKDE